MAGMIEYAVEHGMMEKTALNAMSRKGYRQLDLAHRMIGHAEKGLETSRAGARAKQLAKKRIADLRTDYLHPTKHSVFGDMKGSKRLYKPLHSGGVDPDLARLARRDRSKLLSTHSSLGAEARQERRRLALEMTRTQTSPLLDDINARRVKAKRQYENRYNKGDAALYAPRVRRDGLEFDDHPLAVVKDRPLAGWNRAWSRSHGSLQKSTLRTDPALNTLRQQLQKSNRLLDRSAARGKG